MSGGCCHGVFLGKDLASEQIQRVFVRCAHVIGAQWDLDLDHKRGELKEEPLHVL